MKPEDPGAPRSTLTRQHLVKIFSRKRVGYSTRTIELPVTRITLIWSNYTLRMKYNNYVYGAVQLLHNAFLANFDPLPLSPCHKVSHRPEPPTP